MLAQDKHDRLTSDSCRILRRKMRPGWPEENKSADYIRSVTTAVDGSHRLAAFRRTKPAVIECDSTAKACTRWGSKGGNECNLCGYGRSLHWQRSARYSWSFQRGFCFTSASTRMKP